MSLLKRFSKQISVINNQRRLRNLKEEYLEILQENTNEVVEKFPERGKDFLQFFPVIEEGIVKHIVKVQIPDTEVLNEESVEDHLNDIRNYPVDASSVLFLSDDKMSAYACLLPPINGGKEEDVEDLLEQIKYSGIRYGLNKHTVVQMVREKKYLYPFLLARGLEAKDGIDGVKTDYFERTKAFDIERFQGETIDFEETASMQVIGKGEVLCAIQPATKALDGTDVTGRVLKGKDGKNVEVKIGQNTIISHDGLYLLSKIAGIVSVEEDHKFCVERRHVIKDNIKADEGVISFSDDIIIDGNVLPGAEIHVTGSIIITGEVKGASIFAGGSIRIQKGVKGPAKSVLKSSGQVQCQVIENAVVTADGNVYANGILNSEVISGGSVYVLSGKGMITGGAVRAKGDVHAKEIGNISGTPNLVCAGHIAGLSESIKNTEKELAESKETLEKLRKNVMNLRAVGNILSNDKKEMLKQLMKQKELYESRVDELSKQLKILKEKSSNTIDGKISCLELHPVTEVCIGEKSRIFNEPVTNCRIEYKGGNLTIFSL